MADMTFTTALDERGFRSGMKRIESEARRSATGINQLLRFSVMQQGFRAAMGVAGAAVDAYTSKFESGKQTVDRFTASFDRLNTSLGRDLVGAMEAFTPDIDAFIDRVIVAKDEASDFLARFIDLDTDTVMVRQNAAEKERLDIQMSKIREEQAKLQRAKTVLPKMLRGDAAGPLEAAERRIQDLMEAISPLGLSDKQLANFGVDTRIAEIRRQAMDESAAQSAREIKDLSERMEAEQESTRQRNLDVMLAKESLAFDMQARAIELDRARGLDDSVRKRAVELQYAREIADVERQSLLTIDERLAAIGQLKSFRDQELALLGDRPSAGPPAGPRSATLAGLGAYQGALLNQVFGGGGSTNQVPSLLREQTRILQMIERKTGAAVYGN